MPLHYIIYIFLKCSLNIVLDCGNVRFLSADQHPPAPHPPPFAALRAAAAGLVAAAAADQQLAASLATRGSPFPAAACGSPLPPVSQLMMATAVHGAAPPQDGLRCQREQATVAKGDYLHHHLRSSNAKGVEPRDLQAATPGSGQAAAAGAGQQEEQLQVEGCSGSYSPTVSILCMHNPGLDVELGGDNAAEVERVLQLGGADEVPLHQLPPVPPTLDAAHAATGSFSPAPPPHPSASLAPLTAQPLQAQPSPMTAPTGLGRPMESSAKPPSAKPPQAQPSPMAALVGPMESAAKQPPAKPLQAQPSPMMAADRPMESAVKPPGSAATSHARLHPASCLTSCVKAPQPFKGPQAGQPGGERVPLPLVLRSPTPVAASPAPVAAGCEGVVSPPPEGGAVDTSSALQQQPPASPAQPASAAQRGEDATAHPASSQLQKAEAVSRPQSVMSITPFKAAARLPGTSSKQPLSRFARPATTTVQPQLLVNPAEQGATQVGGSMDTEGKGVQGADCVGECHTAAHAAAAKAAAEQERQEALPAQLAAQATQGVEEGPVAEPDQAAAAPSQAVAVPDQAVAVSCVSKAGRGRRAKEAKPAAAEVVVAVHASAGMHTSVEGCEGGEADTAILHVGGGASFAAVGLKAKDSVKGRKKKSRAKAAAEEAEGEQPSSAELGQAADAAVEAVASGFESVIVGAEAVAAAGRRAGKGPGRLAAEAPRSGVKVEVAEQPREVPLKAKAGNKRRAGARGAGAADTCDQAQVECPAVQQQQVLEAVAPACAAPAVQQQVAGEAAAAPARGRRARAATAVPAECPVAQQQQVVEAAVTSAVAPARGKRAHAATATPEACEDAAPAAEPGQHAAARKRGRSVKDPVATASRPQPITVPAAAAAEEEVVVSAAATVTEGTRAKRGKHAAAAAVLLDPQQQGDAAPAPRCSKGKRPAGVEEEAVPLKQGRAAKRVHVAEAPVAAAAATSSDAQPTAKSKKAAATAVVQQEEVGGTRGRLVRSRGQAAEAEPVVVAVMEPVKASRSRHAGAEPVAAAVIARGRHAEAEPVVAAVPLQVKASRGRHTEAEPVAAAVVEPVKASRARHAEAEPVVAAVPLQVKASRGRHAEAEPVAAAVVEPVKASRARHAVAELVVDAVPVQVKASRGRHAEAEPVAVAVQAKAKGQNAELVAAAAAVPIRAAGRAVPEPVVAAIVEPVKASRGRRHAEAEPVDAAVAVLIKKARVRQAEAEPVVAAAAVVPIKARGKRAAEAEPGGAEAGETGGARRGGRAAGAAKPGPGGQVVKVVVLRGGGAAGRRRV